MSLGNDTLFQSLTAADMKTLARVFARLARDGELAAQAVQLRLAQESAG